MERSGVEQPPDRRTPLRHLRLSQWHTPKNTPRCVSCSRRYPRSARDVPCSLGVDLTHSVGGRLEPNRTRTLEIEVRGGERTSSRFTIVSIERPLESQNSRDAVNDVTKLSDLA